MKIRHRGARHGALNAKVGDSGSSGTKGLEKWEAKHSLNIAGSCDMRCGTQLETLFQ